MEETSTILRAEPMSERTRTPRVEFYPTEEVQSMLEGVESRRRSAWINEAIVAHYKTSVLETPVLTDGQIEDLAERIAKRLQKKLK